MVCDAAASSSRDKTEGQNQNAASSSRVHTVPDELGMYASGRHIMLLYMLCFFLMLFSKESRSNRGGQEEPRWSQGEEEERRSNQGAIEEDKRSRGGAKEEKLWRHRPSTSSTSWPRPTHLGRLLFNNSAACVCKRTALNSRYFTTYCTCTMYWTWAARLLPEQHWQ